MIVITINFIVKSMTCADCWWLFNGSFNRC